MKKLNLKNLATCGIHKIGFGLKKHSPELFLVGGIAAGVATVVVACKETPKALDIWKEHKENVMKIRDIMGDQGLIESREYNEEQGQRDLFIQYVHTGVGFAKTYAPAFALGALSIGCILTSHNVMKKRNLALATAFTALDKSFKGYRSEVVERFGEEVDKQISLGIKPKEVEERSVDENGNEIVTKKTVDSVNPLAMYSPYARFFDAGCTGWEDNPEYNLMFLRAQEKYANDLLRSRAVGQSVGHVFLNEVYDALGIPRSEAGQYVGWVYDPTDDKYDNYISFGIYDVHKENCKDFVNGYEPTILLDFNCDGEIIDRVWKKKKK